MSYDIYLVREQYDQTTGAIYKRTAGAGDFSPILSDFANFFGVTATPTGDVYVSVKGGDIYKQTGGIGAFVALNQTLRDWENLSASPSNNDVFASVAGSLYLYKQTAGVGDFVQYEPSYNSYWRGWSAVSVSHKGDIYACQNYGGIFKQTGGIGDFESQNADGPTWRSLTTAPNGDIYAATLQGAISKQTGGEGAFSGITSPNANATFYGMAISASGDVYAADGNQGVVYVLTGGTGDWAALGGPPGTSGQWRGMGFTKPPLFPTRSYGTIIG